MTEKEALMLARAVVAALRDADNVTLEAVRIDGVWVKPEAVDLIPDTGDTPTGGTPRE